MCRHSYGLTHEKSEKMFRIVTCFMYPRVFTKEGSCGDCCLSCDSSLYFGPRAPQSCNPALSVTRGQCDARPTVTFPAARRHRPLAGTKLYCLVTGTCVLTTCPGFHWIAERPGFELATYWSQVQRPNHSATEPRIYLQLHVILSVLTAIFQMDQG